MQREVHGVSWSLKCVQGGGGKHTPWCVCVCVCVDKTLDGDRLTQVNGGCVQADNDAVGKVAELNGEPRDACRPRGSRPCVAADHDIVTRSQRLSLSTHTLPPSHTHTHTHTRTQHVFI